MLHIGLPHMGFLQLLRNNLPMGHQHLRPPHQGGLNPPQVPHHAKQGLHGHERQQTNDAGDQGWWVADHHPAGHRPEHDNDHRIKRGHFRQHANPKHPHQQ